MEKQEKKTKKKKIWVNSINLIDIISNFSGIIFSAK